MRVAVVHNEPAKGKPDSEDVLDEVSFVVDSLARGRHEFEVFAVGPSGADAVGLLQRLRGYCPQVVFNLVEDVRGEPRLHPAMAAFFELAGYPHTGAPFDALHATTDKTLTKAALKAAGLPTPPWQAYRGEKKGFGLKTPPPWIVKPAWEDASVGIDDDSVFEEKSALLKSLPLTYKRHGLKPLLVEQFIPGREFNISMLEGARGQAEVFPPAEMLYRDWPEGKPRILNYKAKWEEDSFDYINTVRTFKPAAAPIELMKDIARVCWRVFGLRGYARVDFRLNEKGEPFVIEINSNPCISSWAGYVAAAKEAGYGPRELVERIIKAALPRAPRAEKKRTEGRRRPPGVSIRKKPVAEDREAIRRILSSTGLFYPFETDVAVGLLEEALRGGEELIFRFASIKGDTAGFICYGPIVMAKERFDIYWIAVSREAQGIGIGSLLLREAERHMAELGCKHIYVETASRRAYAETRDFYRKNGYAEVARVPRFFAEDDDKVIFMKSV